MIPLPQSLTPDRNPDPWKDSGPVSFRRASFQNNSTKNKTKIQYYHSITMKQDLSHFLFLETSRVKYLLLCQELSVLVSNISMLSQWLDQSIYI